MAELFINPLVPQPVKVSTIQMTTDPVEGYVLTSDSKGNGTWEAAGGSPTVLVVNAVASGPWADNIDLTYTITYVGTPGVTSTMVTLDFDSVDGIANNATFITITSDFPANLRPNGGDNVTFPIIAFNDGTYYQGAGIFSTSAGVMYVEAPGANNFSGSGATGFDSFSISYAI